MTLQFVPAKKENAEESCSLIYSTLLGFGDAALGGESRELCMQALHGFFLREGNRFSHDRTHLVLQEGQIAGLLLAFRGIEFPSRSRALGLQAWQVYGFKAIRRLPGIFQAFGSKETEKDEFYIAHLAVHPDFRRQGLGNYLIEQASILARGMNLYKLSLIADLDNEPAQKLYLRSGFEITQTVETPELYEKFHNPGFHRMVKKI